MPDHLSFEKKQKRIKEKTNMAFAANLFIIDI